MGLRYMTLPATDDGRFSSESGTSHSSPVYSIEPTIPSSSSIGFPPYTNVYQPLGGPTYSSGSNPYFSPSPSIFMPDIKPRLTSIHSPPGMAPPSRSPALPHPVASPLDIRSSYGSQLPDLGRRTSSVLSGSPSTLRGVPLSPSSSGGFASPTNMEGSQLGGQLTPPLNPTEVLHRLQTAEGQQITPEIFGKIDKGFFMADTDWTCYRRNYFSLSCSYTLHPQIPTGTIHLLQNHSGSHLQVLGFAISIAAVVDSQDGKSIELVQHTPKRDKGPQDKPPRIVLAPRPHAGHNLFGGDSGLGSSSRGMYDGTFGQSPNQPQTEATFERIQFKNATANNGKRRAAQQYYHLLVELFADVGQQHPDRWIKVAVRMSAPMVVRGRSPGHYQSERRGSNASAGPGGSGGAGGSGSYTPGSTSRTSGDIGMSGTSSMLQGSSYGSNYDGRSHHYRSHNPNLQIPMEPTLSAEDAKSIEDPPCYMYYPAAIYEESRYHLPSLPEYTSSKIKQEYGGSGSYVLPSLTGGQDSGLGRHCGRWEGAVESRGYFPTMALQQELNIS